MGKLKDLLINTEPTDFKTMSDIINNALFFKPQPQNLQTNQEVARSSQQLAQSTPLANTPTNPYNTTIQSTAYKPTQPQMIYLLMQYDLADNNPMTNTKVIGTYTDGDTADYDMYLMREGDCNMGEYNYEYGIVAQTLNTYQFEPDNQSF